MLILPGSKLYDETLQNSVMYWINQPKLYGGLNYCVDPNTGLFKPLSTKDTIEYLYGGEYDLVEDVADDN